MCGDGALTTYAGCPNRFPIRFCLKCMLMFANIVLTVTVVSHFETNPINSIDRCVRWECVCVCAVSNDGFLLCAKNAKNKNGNKNRNRTRRKWRQFKKNRNIERCQCHNEISDIKYTNKEIRWSGCLKRWNEALNSLQNTKTENRRSDDEKRTKEWTRVIVLFSSCYWTWMHIWMCVGILGRVIIS